MLDEVGCNRGPSRLICHTATVHYAQHVAVLGDAAVTKNVFRISVNIRVRIWLAAFVPGDFS